jgi:putative oxidoreductase
MIDEFEVPSRQTLIIPGLAGLYRLLAPCSYAMARVTLGLALLPVGIDKLFMGGVARIAANNVLRTGLEPPLVWAWAVGCVEFFGALLLIAGLWTRPVAFAVAVEMLVITFRIRFDAGFFITPKGGGMEVSVLLLLICIALLFGGGGRYSADRAIGREF